MNILMVGSECAPFCKTGGLGDVLGSLPRALKRDGVDVRVMLPKYGDIPVHFQEKMQYRTSLVVQVGWRRQHCGIFEMTHDGITYYFIENEYYFKRSGFYGYSDDAERFAFFCQSVLEAIPFTGFHPHIIHCHDWQTAMIPVFKFAHYGDREFYRVIRTIFTIHNLRYQGRFGRETLIDLLNLEPGYYFRNETLEAYGSVNWLKGAVVFSNLVTTVSPTYAKEIQTEHFGEGLHGLLASKGGLLKGIVNGIDDEYWDPNKDAYLEEKYKLSLPKKRKNKLALQEELGLQVDEKIPMIAIVTRLVEQKGVDLIECIFDDIIREGAQVVLLGAGDYNYEAFFRHAAERYPQSVAAQIKYDEALAHRIYASSDLFLMPSAFEPCGIGQMIALRYLSIPIVRETGGLKDTVHQFDPDTDEGVGFTFTDYNAHVLLNKIREAIETYGDEKKWERIVKNASKVDVGWKASAQKYLEMYLSI